MVARGLPPSESRAEIEAIARDARRTAGAVRELLMFAQSDSKVVRISATYTDAFMALSVEDNGPGFAEGVADKLFERFYTTKPAGKGTGLGLWMVAEVVAAHSGTIEAVNTGSGASFVMTIPFHPPEAAA